MLLPALMIEIVWCVNWSVHANHAMVCKFCNSKYYRNCASQIIPAVWYHITDIAKDKYIANAQMWSFIVQQIVLIRSVLEEAIQYSWLSRHTAVCQQLRIQKMHGPQVCNTGTVKLLNSAFRISKPSQLLS